MPQASLNRTWIERLPTPATETVYWDKALPGFGMKLTPAGKRIYIVKYRHLGRQRKLTIGNYPAMMPDKARELATRALLAVKEGADPAGQRRILVAEPTIAEAFDEFIRAHCEAKRKPRTASEYRKLFDPHVAPKIGKRKLSDIARADFVAIHRAMEDTPYAANRMIAVMRKFMNWTEEVGLRPERSNPILRIEQYRETARERFLTPAELARLGAALHGHESTAWPPALAAIRLLILLGLRKSEVLTLRWEHLDLQAQRITLPESKTGRRMVALNDAAAEVIGEMVRFRDAFPAASPWVIPSPTDRSKPLVLIEKLWRKIRVEAGLADVRIHDLRHSFASIGAASKVPQMLLKSLLGHSQLSTTDKYVHFADDPAREASNQIASEIAKHLGAGSNIRQLRR